MSTACGWLLFVQYASCVYMDVRTPTHMCTQVHAHRGEIKEREFWTSFFQIDAIQLLHGISVSPKSFRWTWAPPIFPDQGHFLLVSICMGPWHEKKKLKHSHFKTAMIRRLYVGDSIHVSLTVTASVAWRPTKFRSQIPRTEGDKQSQVQAWWMLWK